MKRMNASTDWPLLRAKWRKILITGRAFFLLSASSMALFVLLGLGGLLQNKLSVSPVQSMKGMAASLSGQFFQSLLAMEMPHMEASADSPFETGRMASFLLWFMTDVNPDNPKSLLSLELPGMDRDRSVLLRPGTGAPEAPEDHGPLTEEGLTADHGDPAESQDPDRFPETEPDNEPSASPEPSGGEDKSSPDEEPSTEGRKIAFIYHSHNRESYYPELKEGTKDPNSSKINVTLVGKRLAGQLEKRGIGAVHSPKDYPTSVQGYNWNYSYKYSLQTVRQAMADNEDLKLFFDIHRDSQRRAKTTATIKDKDYAQVYFIIGHRNPNWRENEDFANRIHERLEKQYPGLSRGVWGKTAANGNGEYNQSVAPGSVLIEIGGVDNTLEECYRTADALAKVISDIYWNDEKAIEAAAPQK
ncbi:stage II sporulation protein P [Cohnella sp. CIP 111063]|uniref:stage II sporulation protein P n=1 Tax=unclassified Cohnella TaxID=2636738 RepID=UPI000B8C07C1|nr:MULTISPECIES: stage II sporulation protein P [unclassified Cohnella]OXS62527.1 stage II sporulation protein P [Cohnella sp. CIP 111063]PRX74775.1 stage II sporulation protein P [Cohnella sp. SGD-V74]